MKHCPTRKCKRVVIHFIFCGLSISCGTARQGQGTCDDQHHSQVEKYVTHTWHGLSSLWSLAEMNVALAGSVARGHQKLSPAVTCLWGQHQLPPAWCADPHRGAPP